MAHADDVLRDVIEAVADGSPVDWARAESTPMTPDERAMLEQLKVLEGLHRLHRSGSVDAAAVDNGPSHTVHVPLDAVTETRAAAAEAPNRWGPLEIRGVLGAGGFGIVYRAWDPNLARDVALKVLTREPAGSGEAVINEARLLARVRHENIVSIYGAERWGGQVGLWMEFVRGRTLKEIVRQQGTLGAREAALVGLALTRALAAVHGAGLVHRDVKPHNVMRDESGRIVLMDFGAGIDLDRREARQSRYVGTPLYMAPELFDDNRPSSKSDLYSLGVLLYHLVTAAYPVDGQNPDDVRRKHVAGDRRRLRDVRPDLPAEFVRIVERAIDPDARRRYLSAGELEADLGRFVVHDEGGTRSRWRRLVAYAAIAVSLVALVAAGIGIAALAGGARRPPAPPSASTLRSIVVLPLRNATGDPAQDYFVDGMTELLTADLSGVSALRVIADSSAGRYRGTNKSGGEIGRELHVDAVVEGSVARSGNRVRVTLQVVHAGTNLSLWGSSFDREASDAFQLQADIARTLVAQLRAVLTPAETRRLAQTYVPGAQAQDLYLRGRFLLHTFNKDSLKEARTLFERAVELEPAYALAWTSLARCYLALQDWGVLTATESRRLGLSAARTAIERDPGMFEAHSQLAEALFRSDWNWTEADVHYRQAVEANPSFSMGRWQFARFLAAAGRLDDALDQARRSEQADPLSTDAKGTVSIVLLYQRRYTEALSKADEALALDGAQPSSHVARSRALAGLRRFDEAVKADEEALRLSGGRVAVLGDLGRVYALMGRRQDADRVINQVSIPQRAGEPVDAVDAAYVQLANGQPDEGLTSLERAADARSDRILWLRVDPRVDAVRGNARFNRLVERIGGLP